MKRDHTPTDVATCAEGLDEDATAATRDLPGGLESLYAGDARLAGLPSYLVPQERLPPGGMGEILVARDTRHDRDLVVKIALRGPGESPARRSRFEAERKLTAGLDHAGVVPVIDSGELEDGRLWFAMRRVRGLTLDELARWARSGAPPARESIPDGAWPLRRFLEVFLRICEIVGDAHGRGIVHRDLKPQNVMVDTRGDAFVLDWGIALASGDDAPGARPEEGAGALGTPSYMPPEQALGQVELHGPQSDVYALGGILYFLLSGDPPHPGGISGPLRPVAEAAGGAVDPELARICEAAMARDPRDRPANGLRLAQEVRAWLDADARRTHARTLISEALAHRAVAEERAAEARRLREQADAILAPLRPFDAEERKRPAWDLQEEARRIEGLAERAWAEHEQNLRAAIAVDPAAGEAHDHLADRYLGALLDAEARGDAPAAARAEFLLGEHARGERRAWLRAEGALTLLTDPPARVRVERYERRYGRLFPERRPDLDFHAPVADLTLPAGSYRLWLEADGLPPVPYPVLIRRGERWRGVPPGETDPLPVPLRPAVGLGADDCYVPPGWFRCGGDPDAPDAMPAREVWVDGFVIRRYPVTCGEYIAFLDDLVAQGEEELAERWTPRPVDEAVRAGGSVYRSEEGRYVLGVGVGGLPWQADWPVTLVSWEAAVGYASWEARRTGLLWRLLDELEWEKAARGVDARLFPWGDHLDPIWTCMLHSHIGRPQPAPIHAYPSDESVYGVCCLGGNARDWCLNAFSRLGAPGSVRRVEPGSTGEDSTYRVVRGGSFSSTPNWCRVTARFASVPSQCMTGVGFRLSRSIG